MWDKGTGNIRVEWTHCESKKAYVALMNLHTKQGRVWEEGQELSGEGLDQALRQTEGAWINDSYWLFMPYKLKDLGVTLKYLGTKTDPDGNECRVLELTFKEVGRTSDCVVQWDYWKDRAVDEPRSLSPWNNWRKFGNVMITGGGGTRT